MSKRLRFDDVEIDPQSFRLTKSGTTLQVEPKSLKVLMVLAESGGRLVSRQELIDSVWGTSFVTDHVLNRAIGQLRKALKEDPKKPRYIETVPTLGYRFIAQLDPVTDSAESIAGVPSPRVEKAEPPPSALTTRLWMRGVFRIGFVAAVLLAVTLFFFIRMERTRTTAGHIRALVVLPLKNLSGDPAQDYLADGMTDQLITNLGQIGVLTVISPTTAMQYRNTRKPLSQIARELHVDAVIEGSAASMGDQLRIDVHLIDAHADRQLWARSFDGTLRDAFSLQNRVASAVAEKLRVEPTPRERSQLATNSTTNPKAYEAFLKGHYFEEETNPDAERKALRYYQQAVELDPGFARAFVGIALAYNFLGDADAMPSGEATTAADSAVATALSLDPDLAEAYGERGWMEMFYHWDFAGAARDFRHAIELDPGDATFYQGLGDYFVHVGQFDLGFQQIQHSIDLDPLSRRDQVDFCNALMLAKRFDDAVQHCNAALELDPHFQFGLDTLQELYERRGNYDAAHDVIKRLGWCSDDLCMAADDEIHGRPGTVGSWDAWIKTLKTPLDPIDAAMADTGLHRNDQALADIEKIYAQHIGMQFMTYLNIDPFFSPLYSDARFDAFLKHAGLQPRPKP